MKTLVTVLFFAMAASSFAQTPTPTPKAYAGPSSTIIQKQLKLMSDMAIVQADQEDLQQAQKEQRSAQIAAQVAKLNAQLTAAQAAGK